MTQDLNTAHGLDTVGGPSQGQSTHVALLEIARRRKSLIALGFVGCLVLGALYYAVATPVYEAKAQLLVIKKSPNNSLPGLDPTHAGTEDYLSTQAGIIKSPAVVSRAVQERSLSSLRSFQGVSDPTDSIVRDLKVTRDPKDLHNSILELSFRARSPEDSAAVLDASIDAYKEFLDETYRSVSDETLKLVTRVRDDWEKDLTRKEEEFRQFRMKTPLHLFKGQNGSSFNDEQLLLIHSKQLDVQIRRQEIEARLQAIEEAWKGGRNQDEVISMLSRLNNQSTRSTLGGTSERVYTDGVEEELIPALLAAKTLAVNYGPNYPDRQAAEEKVTLAYRLVLSNLRHEVEDLKRTEKLLADTFADHAEEAKKAVAYDVEEDGFRNDILRIGQLYDLTVKRLQDADIIKDLGGFDAQSIGPPTSKQVAPKATLVFPLAGLVGLLAGFGLGYAAEATDKTFRSAEEIRRRLALPVIGHVPQIVLKREALEAIAASGSPYEPTLCTYHRPRSREAEAYRGIRTALYFSTRGGGQKVLQVTSPSAGDGKTTLTVNLAVSIAQSGKRTLLIDADLRRPRVHKVVGLAPTVGLSSVINGEVELEEAIQESGIPNLAILPCGRIPSNPAELLTSPRFQEVINATRERYDLILIDSPPLLAVTDPSVVAPRVDGVILTMRIAKNGRPRAERAKDILETLGAGILGVVVNGVAFRGQGYGAEGYEDYSYYRPGKSQGRDEEYYEEKEAEQTGRTSPEEGQREKLNGQVHQDK